MPNINSSFEHQIAENMAALTAPTDQWERRIESARLAVRERGAFITALELADPRTNAGVV